MCQVEDSVLRVDDDDARGGRRAWRGAYLRPARYRRDTAEMLMGDTGTAEMYAVSFAGVSWRMFAHL